MRTSAEVSLPLWPGLEAARGLPGSAPAQLSTRASGPRLVVPTSQTDVVEEKPLPTHLGGVKYTDMVTQKRPGGFAELIRDFLQEKNTKFDGRLVGVDSSSATQSQNGFRYARLTEVDVPTPDRSGKGTGYITIRLASEYSGAGTPHPVPTSLAVNSELRLWQRSNFTLAVSGLEANKVSRIEEFGFGFRPVEDQLGEVRQSTVQPGHTGWGLLTVTFSTAAAPGWIAWRDDFILHNGQGAERSLTLTMLGSDMATPLLALTGSGVGIVALWRLPTTAADPMPKYQANLYVEHWVCR